MAEIPVPRSYNQILGNILDAFLARYGISRLKIGGPLLSILEAAAQSDTRSTQDIFNLLDSIFVDNATGTALDAIAKAEETARIPVTASNGFVTFSDSSFTKKTTAMNADAIAASTLLKIDDGASFPATGTVYIGRGTATYEAASYSANVFNIDHWELTLTAPIGLFHSRGESVILAQGGVRVIPAGTVVQTSQSNGSDAIKFSTLFSAQIEDGEVTLSGIQVVCQQPGVVGNVPYGTIKQVPSTPYRGAEVTNPLPFSNGLPAENDQTLRERIKNIRNSKQKGTTLAITTGIKGVSSSFDGKTLVSSSIIDSGDMAELFIDDGSGYEETYVGVGRETLADIAIGGEDVFQLSSSRPVAKATIETSNSAPYSGLASSVLSVSVGGKFYDHTFLSSDFRDATAATAYEVVSSINKNFNLQFSARTSGGGTKVILKAKTEVNEELEAQSSGANLILGFPAGIHYSLKLYKNGTRLYKDGSSAIVYSDYQSNWVPFSTSSMALVIAVDGVSVSTSIVSADFPIEGVVSNANSLSSWVTALSSKIPGVTVYQESGKLAIKSNRGNSSLASIQISVGPFTTDLKFSSSLIVGSTSDFTMSRNSGQIRLSTPLSVGSNLVAGSNSDRARVFSTTNVLATQAGPNDSLTVVVDNSASKTLTVPFYKEIKPKIGEVYGNVFKVTDLSGNSLTNTFGVTSTLFDGFKLFMKDRVKTHSGTLNKTILWRDVEWNYGTNTSAKLSFVNPTTPNSSVAINADTSTSVRNFTVSLASGAEKVIANQNRARLSRAVNESYISKTGSVSVSRTANLTTVTLDVSTIDNQHALVAGDVVFLHADSSGGDFLRGPKIVNSVTGNTFDFVDNNPNATDSSGLRFDVCRKPAGDKYAISGIQVLTSTTVKFFLTGIGISTFTAGDTVYFTCGHYDITAGLIPDDSYTVLSTDGSTYIIVEKVGASLTPGAAAIPTGSAAAYFISTGAYSRVALTAYRTQALTGAVTRTLSSVTVSFSGTKTALVRQCKFNIGDIVYCTSSDVNYPSGAKIITSVNEVAGTFSYNEAGTTTPSLSVIYYSLNSTELDFSSLASDDIVAFSGIGSRIDFASATRINILESDELTSSISTKPYFTATNTRLTSSSTFKFFPLNASANTAALISAINSAYVTKTLIGDGSVAITRATLDEFNTNVVNHGAQSVKEFTLVDGVNEVSITDLNASFSQLTIGPAIANSDLVSGSSDFSNEVMRLVPGSLTNAVNLLNSTGFTNLSYHCDITNPIDPILIVTKTDGSAGAIQVSGSIQSKYGFSAIKSVGIDAYRYNTGLLAEVHKVVYGDESSPDVYPGIVATPMKVYISGPILKKIQTHLQVRLRGGIAETDVTNRIKNAVASEINSTPIGTSIAISDIIAAANSVNGVLAVSVIAPIYGTSNDIISIQANEKAKVLDIDNDVQITVL